MSVKRKIFYRLSLLLMLSFANISCDKKIDPGAIDILSYYEVLEKIEPTYLIDFAFPQSEDYLLEGWSYDEKMHRWAEGLESQFFFYGVQEGSQNDLEMAVNCAPFVFPGSPKQSMDIYLNDQFLKKISLSPSWNQYTVSLPGKLLKEKNIIVFKYRYAGKTSIQPLKAQGERKLSVAFTRVIFSSTPSLQLKGNALYQKTGSLLNYYEKIPTHGQLKFHFKNKKESRVRGCVKIESQGIKPETYFFEQSGDFSIDLEKYAGRITKISFKVEKHDTERSDRSKAIDNPIRWSNIVLYASHSEEKTSRVQDGGALWAVREKLKKCDIIYVVLDAYAAKHSSAYGYHRKTSPMLEELAAQGVLFENMFTVAPITWASTASLFTSKYPFEHQITKENDKLSPYLMTLAKKLSDHNISSYCISAHPYITKEFSNLTGGFEDVYYRYWFDPTFLIDEIFPKIYGLKRMEARRKFLYIHIMPPHSPYKPPKRFRLFGDIASKESQIIVENDFLKRISKGDIQIDRQQLQSIISLYDANILCADEYIKKVVMYLKDKRLIDNVILIVSSDHGEAFMEHGNLLHGQNVYDELIHVPFVIMFPKSIGIKNVRISGLASLIDVGPTILDMLDLKKEDEFRGKSFLPVMFEDKKGEAKIYSSITGGSYSRCLRGNEYKYIYFPNRSDEDELYDLSNDPLEQRNIIEKAPIIAGYYLQQLKMLEKGTPHVEKQKVDLNKIDPEKLKQLKELGYVQ